MFISMVARLLLLQSNVPGLDGYARAHWPFWTCATTTHGDGT